MPRTHRPASLSLVLCALLLACSGSGGSGGGSGDAPAGSRQYRAIAGVSMGGYGALNLGTKRVDLFGAIGSLGGPVDLWVLLEDILFENLEVKRVAGVPSMVGDDFTFDLLPPYPDRSTRISFTRDLVLAFGNPVLHHPDPDFAYLADDSQPAQILADDEWGNLVIPADPLGFADGGDDNEDGLRQTDEQVADDPVEVLLVAQGTLLSVFGEAGVDVGGRMLADTNDDTIFDLGDGLVVNLREPFVDTNGDRIRNAGEAFDDFGLDGVPATGDFGEGNGSFDRDPDVARWLDQDPYTRLQARPRSEIQRQRIYMDVGVDDELGFARHYDNLVDLLANDKNLFVDVHEGFDGSCASVPDVDSGYTLVRYPGGHVGFAGSDSIVEDLLDGDVCGPATVWQRLLHLLVAMDAAFADGDYGPGGIIPVGETIVEDVASPALALDGQPVPLRRVVVYRPPAARNSNDDTFPILYFLGGYGQDPEDFERVGVLMDLLIAANVVQNMYLAFVPGEGGTQGSFYVNHRVSESQVPGLIPVTSGRYEDSLIDDLLPAIENDLLERRVR